MGGRRGGGTREEGAPGTGETGVGGELGEWRRRDAPWERRLERGYQGFGEEALGKAEGPRRVGTSPCPLHPPRWGTCAPRGTLRCRQVAPGRGAKEREVCGHQRVASLLCARWVVQKASGGNLGLYFP